MPDWLNNIVFGHFLVLEDGSPPRPDGCTEEAVYDRLYGHRVGCEIPKRVQNVARSTRGPASVPGEAGVVDDLGAIRAARAKSLLEASTA